MQNKVTFFILFVSLFCFFIGCDKDLSPLHEPKISLEVEYVDVTEVWLNLNISDAKTAQNYVIERNDKKVFKGKIKSDSLFMDTGLLPNQEYSYFAYIYNGLKTNQTKTLKVTTRDTTSHEFIWSIDMPGIYGKFFDTNIINENNIWACGEIRTDSGSCAAAHWNGTKWELVKTVWNSFNVNRLHSIWGESSTNFWSANGSVFYWNGSKLEMGYQVLGTQKALISIWGTNYSNLYFTGNGGNIVHYNGSGFKQMNSRTDIDLKSISGNQRGDVFIIGYEDSGENIILQLVNNSWKILYQYTGSIQNPFGYYGRIRDVFCGENFAYFLTSNGLLKYGLNRNFKKSIADRDFGINDFTMQNIKGQEENDFFIVSKYGKIVHWNGYSWSTQNEIYNRYPDKTITVYGVDYNDNTIAIVGTYNTSSQGFIIIGKRY